MGSIIRPNGAKRRREREGQAARRRKRKPALVKSEERFRLVAEAAANAMVMIGAAGQIEMVNSQAERMFGYSRSELLGQNIEMLVPERFRGHHPALRVAFFHDPRSRPMGAGRDLFGLRKDGGEFPVEIGLNPIETDEGPMVLSAIVDISARKRLEERFRRVVEAAPSAMVMINATGRIEMVNAQAERVFGYLRAELLGQTVEMLVPERFRGHHPALRGAFFGNPGSRPMGAGRDLFGLRKDGSEFPIEIGLNPIETDEGPMVLSAIVDISARRQAEDALRDANEVAQQARITADNANRAKTEFLAVMSHEIRTPLNSISGFVDLLTTTTTLTPQQRRYAALVKTANAALLTIVNDILDFSKVEAGQLDLELRAFSLLSLIHDTIEIVAPSAMAKSLLLSYAIAPDVPEWVMGDHARLRQVLLNLLNNAVKFTETGSIMLDVRQQIAVDGCERLQFSVTDTGIGVPVAQQHRLFKQFSQADSSVNRRHGGSGLGLAICKRLVELMDGAIGIVSEDGRGSTVWFTALMPPVSEPAPTPAAEPPIQDIVKRKARILVIDDIDTNLEIVEAYLQDNGYQVDCVTSGLDAIQMLGHQHYDLILMDIQMPIMDGVAATRRIRALPSPIRDIPIIAMTGNVLPQQVRSFLEAGMNDHVGKPIERAKLYNNVRRWLPKVARAELRIGLDSPNFDRLKFEEFIADLGAEKAEAIAEKFLANLTAAFKSSAAEAQRQAHALINTAGVLGLDGFVASCRRAADFLASGDPDRVRAAMEELRRAQSAARQAMTTQLLPKLRGQPLMIMG